MSGERTHHATLTLVDHFTFTGAFPDLPNAPAILFDEPAPLGEDKAPSAASYLGAAVGNCLAASLAFCLRKSRVEPETLSANVTTRVERNAEGKFRISGIDVELIPSVAAADAGKLARCESLFEDFCIVTQSVRSGIPVNVTVRDRGRTLVGAGALKEERCATPVRALR